MNIEHIAVGDQARISKGSSETSNVFARFSPPSEPRNSITGALNPSPSSSFLSDMGWLTISWPSNTLSIGRVLAQYEAMTLDAWLTEGKTAHYTYARKSMAGTLIGWSPKNPRSMISISQQAIEEMGAGRLLPFAQWMFELCAARVTRSDFSITDYTHTINTDRIIAALEAKHYVGNAKKFQPFIEFDIKTGKRSNDGVGIGKRSSEVYYRAYNKFIESKGEIDAYRLEVEFKGDVSRANFAYLMQQSCNFYTDGDHQFVSNVSEQDFRRACAEIVLGRIDFRARGERAHIEDCPRLDWWDDVHQKIYVQPFKQATVRKAVKLEVTCEWFFTCIATLASMLADWSGNQGQFFSDLYTYGKRNLTNRQRIILEQAQNFAFPRPPNIDPNGEIFLGPYGELQVQA